jgi:hypothetical protein
MAHQPHQKPDRQKLYHQRIRRLRIVLPSVAVILTIFLVLSYNNNAVRRAVQDFAFDVAQPSISGLRMPGTSADGNAFLVQAARVDALSQNQVSLVDLVIDLAANPKLEVRAPAGRYDKDAQFLVLERPVHIQQAPDFNIRLGVSNIRLIERQLQSSDGFYAQGRDGLVLEANRVTSDMSRGEHHFSGNIRLHIPAQHIPAQRLPDEGGR